MPKKVRRHPKDAPPSLSSWGIKPRHVPGTSNLDIPTAIAALHVESNPDRTAAITFLTQLLPHVPPDSASYRQHLRPWAETLSTLDAPPDELKTLATAIMDKVSAPATPSEPNGSALSFELVFDGIVQKIDGTAKTAFQILLANPIEKADLIRLTQRMIALDRILGLYSAEERNEMLGATDGTPILATTVAVLLSQDKIRAHLKATVELERIHQHFADQSNHYAADPAEQGLPLDLLCMGAIIGKEAADEACKLVDDSLYETPTHRMLAGVDERVTRALNCFLAVRQLIDQTPVNHPSLAGYAGEMNNAVAHLAASLQGVLGEWSAMSTSRAYQALTTRCQALRTALQP